MIKEIYTQSSGRYGSPRITAELKRQGYACNHKRVARLMRKMGLAAKLFRRYKVTTQSNHQQTRRANLLGGHFNSTRPNRIRTGDITYIRTAEGWLYLAAILDTYSRMIVGWETSSRLHSPLVEDALKNALKNRSISPGIIFHSDQGIQYASESFRKLLERYGFQQSMSGRGNCYDNAITESFFHTLKTEMVNRHRFKTRQEARTKIFEYIELFYNRNRLHSGIGYRSPFEYERLTKLT